MVGRRPFICAALGGIAGVMTGEPVRGDAALIASWGDTGLEPDSGGREHNGKTVLLAYFSRPGENHYFGDHTDLQVGNTEVLAGMICEQIPCDVYRIEAVDS